MKSDMSSSLSDANDDETEAITIGRDLSLPPGLQDDHDNHDEDDDDEERRELNSKSKDRQTRQKRYSKNDPVLYQTIHQDTNNVHNHTFSGSGGGDGILIVLRKLWLGGFVLFLISAIIMIGYGREVKEQQDTDQMALQDSLYDDLDYTNDKHHHHRRDNDTVQTATATTTTTDDVVKCPHEDHTPINTNNNPNQKEDNASIRYQPNAAIHQHDPFHVANPEWYGSIFVDPPHPSLHLLQNSDDHNDQYNNIGYIQYPNIHNNTIVFCTEGDVYLTTLQQPQQAPMPAMRLTSTVGNTNTPHINPQYPHLIAFTATYTGNREAYLMDLRPGYRSRPSVRLTYMDSDWGVSAIDGWEEDGQSLVIRSRSIQIGIEDERLYKVGVVIVDDDNLDDVDNEGNGVQQPRPKPQHMLKQMTASTPITISNIQPVPLSQAIDSATLKTETSECRYFTRFRQSSHTARYLGGTAEHLWAYCTGQRVAVPLTDDYRGTSKAPGLYSVQGAGLDLEVEDVLLFLSDRQFGNDDGGGEENSKWVASTMNLWGVPVPSEDKLYTSDHDSESDSLDDRKLFDRVPFQITSISCDFNGMPLAEYAIDHVTGNILLRIGADLHILPRDEVLEKIRNGLNSDRSLGTKAKYGKTNQTNTPFSDDSNLQPSPLTGSDGDVTSQTTVNPTKPNRLPVTVYSDFNNLHERIVPLNNPRDVSTIDVYATAYGTISTLMTARGQLFVNPVIKDASLYKPYAGGAMNMPPRRYKVAPGSVTGGMIRILGSWHVPKPAAEDKIEQSRIALVLATDPLSPTAEMAFYLLETSSESVVEFADVSDLPKPFLGGHVNGGSVRDGGLGSVNVDSVTVSPCGRRGAWTDTDGRVVVMTLPILEEVQLDAPELNVLPQENENGQPMVGIEAGLTWSPAGRYLAIEHNARNQFQIISIADLGDPTEGTLNVTRIVQATPDRFNSMSPFWGRASVDFQVEKIARSTLLATTLYFLTDRDIILSGNTSPWGTRAPSPYFSQRSHVYALPLVQKEDEMKVDPMEELYGGSFVGDGAAELMLDHINAWDNAIGNLGEEERKRKLNSENDADVGITILDGEESMDDSNITTLESASLYPTDVPISFGDPTDNMRFARRAYVMSHIPASNYLSIMQMNDDPSLLLSERGSASTFIKLFNMEDFPSDGVEEIPLQPEGLILEALGMSTNKKYLYFTYSGRTKVIPNSVSEFAALFMSDLREFSKNIVDTHNWAVSIWPKLEYQQMYGDAWRMLRDYYYDPGMGNIDWPLIHSRYLPLVSRCGRREELDDVLAQMASELSALHVFVYGGEYNDPLHGSEIMRVLNEKASLGATLERSVEWGGYVVNDIPESDPDFNPLDNIPIYSPLSERTLRMGGQRGLLPGDVIVSVNGESVMNVPDIHMLLRGMAGRSIRLDVLRVKSSSTFSSVRRKAVENEKDEDKELIPEPVIVVPITPVAAANLRYAAWEWKTRESAKNLAISAGFSVGYMHLRSMSGAEAEDSFVRGLYPDYDKQALIIDVRHNHGGNIDSWLLDSLQRRAWMYWQGRATNITNGGLGWDEQFAFRGHLVVLIDEKTSSDGEGFSRGVSELGLGKLVGTRTWGGGIWLSSDNHLVDGGIATAPEIGTYNKKFGWGMGIEQMGVEPDIEIDNDPKETFDGKDRQLNHAIEFLKSWLESEPVVLPQDPGPHRDMSLHENVEGCAVR